jgi:hypothetical protein
MKKQIEILALCLAMATTSFAAPTLGASIADSEMGMEMEKDKNSEKQSIEECIIGFAKAGDLNDATALSAYLDANYRVVMNRLFGSEEAQVVDKTFYLDKIRSKEWGGDTRTISVEGILINGDSATAKVKLVGEKSTVSSLFLLVKNAEGDWQIISDTPVF